MIQGPTSYDDLRRKPDGCLFDTFYDAAVHHNLLASNTLWNETANEACRSLRSRHRSLAWIVTFLMRIQPKNALEIIEQNIDQLDGYHPDDGPETRLIRVIRRLDSIARRSREGRDSPWQRIKEQLLADLPGLQFDPPLRGADRIQVII